MLSSRWERLIRRPGYTLSVWPVKMERVSFVQCFHSRTQLAEVEPESENFAWILLDSIGSSKICALTPLESLAELLCRHASSTPQDSCMTYVFTSLTLRVKRRTSRAISSSSSTFGHQRSAISSVSLVIQASFAVNGYVYIQGAPSGSRSSSVSTSPPGECSRLNM